MAGTAKKASFGSNLFWALMITLFIISFAVVFVLYFRPLYYLDINLMRLDQASGVSADAIRKDYDSIINYMYVWNRSPLTFTSFVMSEHGRIHFADCKRIFDVVQIICAVSGVLTLVSFFRHRHGGNSRYLMMAGVLTIAIPTVVGVLCALRWDDAFIWFHRIFFRNNYWLFDSREDPIILVLPDGFFLQCAVVILVIVLLGGIICIVRAVKRRKKVAAWRSSRRR